MVVYEWDCETVGSIDTDEFAEGDVIEHAHAPTLRETLKWAREEPLEPGTRYEIVLVRDDNEGRSWAYLEENGALPEYFLDAYDRRVAKVPKRFHAETARCIEGQAFEFNAARLQCGTSTQLFRAAIRAFARTR
jgi:hypothetical protein